jgi:hypothetical protein
MIADLEYLKLSVRKDRKVYLALPAVMVGTLLLSLFGLENGTREASSAAQGIVVFWALLGLPIVGAVLGGSGGAEARAEAELESPLPLSAARRALGRLAATVAGLAVLAAVLWAIGAALPDGGRRHPSPDGDIAKCAIYATYGLVSAFAIGYATASSAIGALGGLLVTTELTVIFGEVVVMQILYPGRGPFLSTVLGLAVAGLAAAALSVALTARLRLWRSESELVHGLAQAAVAGALTALVLLLSQRFVRRYWEGLELYGGFMGTLTPAPAGSKFALRVRQRAPSGGVYANSLDGRVVWLGADGRRVEAAPPRGERGLLQRLKDLPNAGGGDLFFSSDGLAWLLRPDGAGGAEVWRGRTGRAMSRIASYPEGTWADALVETPAGMALLRSNHTEALVEPLAAPRWRKASGTGSWNWRYFTGAPLPDGRTASVWQDKDGRAHGLGTVKVRAPDGALVERGVVPIGPDGPWPALVRLDERRAWYIEGRRLAERDLAGKLLASWRLPGRPKKNGKTISVRIASEGLYVRTRGTVTLVDWDGRVKGSFPL